MADSSAVTKDRHVTSARVLDAHAEDARTAERSSDGLGARGLGHVALREPAPERGAAHDARAVTDLGAKRSKRFARAAGERLVHPHGRVRRLEQHDYLRLGTRQARAERDREADGELERAHADRTPADREPLPSRDAPASHPTRRVTARTSGPKPASKRSPAVTSPASAPPMCASCAT